MLHTYTQKYLSKIDHSALTDRKIHEIAQRIEGFSGRTIEQLIINFGITAKQKNNKLTNAIIERKVAAMIKEEENMKAFG